MKKHSVVVSVYLDTRRALDNGLFPVKLRVYSGAQKKTKFYPLNLELSKADFQSVWETSKTRAEHKLLKKQLQAVIDKAEDAVNSLAHFSFTEFEKRLNRKSVDASNVFYHYDLIINSFNSKNQLGTKEIYDLSRKSIKAFIKANTGKESDYLAFTQVDKEWLEEYEFHMIATMGRSRTTVSMYLRSLRAVFNSAIETKDIPSEIYPFGKRRYRVPAVKKVNKALNHSELSKLYFAEPKTSAQKTAKDFWFLSYYCNGMNIKDIALLKKQDIQGNLLVFYRAKTINTSRESLTPTMVYLTDDARKIIERYQVEGAGAKDYIFPIVSQKDSAEEQRKKIKGFTRMINQHMKRFANDLNITNEVSTYWARHSFATNSIRLGASIEFVHDALDHADMRTTKNYIAGFEEETKKVIMEKLSSFDKPVNA